MERVRPDDAGGGGRPLRVVVADDAPFLREAIGLILRSNGFDVVSEVGTAPAAVTAALELVPDVVVMDVRMPPGNGSDGVVAAVSIRKRQPKIGILLLSQQVERAFLGQLLATSPRGVGYLLKERVAGTSQFLHAVRRVAEDGIAIDPLVIETLRKQSGHDTLTRLSGREREVLELIAEGRSNQGVAEALSITPRTVENHVRAIFNTLDLPEESDVNRRVLAVLRHLGVAPRSLADD